MSATWSAAARPQAEPSTRVRSGARHNIAASGAAPAGMPPLGGGNQGLRMRFRGARLTLFIVPVVVGLILTTRVSSAAPTTGSACSSPATVCWARPSSSLPPGPGGASRTRTESPRSLLARTRPHPPRRMSTGDATTRYGPAGSRLRRGLSRQRGPRRRRRRLRSGARPGRRPRRSAARPDRSAGTVLAGLSQIAPGSPFAAACRPRRRPVGGITCAIPSGCCDSRSDTGRADRRPW